MRKESAKRLQLIEKKGDNWWRGMGIASKSWENILQLLSLVKGKLVKDSALSGSAGFGSSEAT